MAIGGAFLGGGVEVVPAGSCKLELEILTEDRANLTATFTIKGTSTYTVTAGADGRAVYTVPAGQTYTVSVNTTGYDNIASQTVIAESGTVRYVRFEAFSGRVKRSGDTMTGTLAVVGGASIDTNGQVIGKKLRATADIHLGSSPSSYAVINDGWIQNRTIDETKADLGINDKVGKSGNETISGAKTFEEVIILRNDSVKAITFNKADGTTIGWSQIDGNNNMDHTCTLGNLTLSAPNGRVYATTTPSDATSNEIATANWSLGKFLKKSGDNMTGILGIVTSLPQMYLTNTTDDFTVPATAVNTTHYLGYLDKNGQDTFNISEYKYKGGRGLAITLKNKTTGEVKEANIGLMVEDGGAVYTTAPTPSSASDNSAKIATTAWVNTASCVVHTYNAESILGLKTFKEPIRLVNDSVSYTQSQDASTWTYLRGIEFRDKASERMGEIRSVRYTITAGVLVNSTEIIARGKDNIDTLLAVVTADDGSKYAYCPSTPSNATGNQIVTADWAYDKFQRKITYGTGDPPSGGQAGDIYIKI